MQKLWIYIKINHLTVMSAIRLTNLILYFRCRRVALILNSSYVSKLYGFCSRHIISHAMIKLFDEALAKFYNGPSKPVTFHYCEFNYCEKHVR